MAVETAHFFKSPLVLLVCYVFYYFESGISVSSTKGKLQILQQHYQLLGTSMVDSAFDDEWKLEVEEKVLEYSKQNLKDLDLDKEIEESEIVRCINKL